MRRLTILGCCAAPGALTVATAILAHRRPEESLANGSVAVLVLQTVAAAALLAAGALVWTARAAPVGGALLLAAGVAVDAQALPLPDAGGALLFTLALTLAASAAPVAAWAAIEVGEHPTLIERALAAAAVAAGVLWVGLLPSTLFDPPATGCFRCPANLVLVYGDPDLRSHVARSGLQAAAILFALLALALLASAARRHWSVAAAQAGAALALLAVADARWRRTGNEAAWSLECAGLVVVAAGPLAEIARARMERARIADAVLRTVPTSDELRAALAASAGDRSLELVYPRASGGAVDSDGVLVAPLENGTRTTEVLRDGEVIAQLRHQELTAQGARRLGGSVRAAGLALEHTSSRARLRAQLTDLTASRARVVEAADAERKRLERNLHDGAQQRLIALSVALGSDGGLADARREVLAALAELRTLAHGIHPASLSDGGILPSVRELAEASKVPLRLDVRPLGRLPEPVEAAAYRVVADCVRAAERAGNSRAVSVVVETRGSALGVSLCLPGVTAVAARRALLHAADRVTAVGGNLRVTSRSGDTVVEVSLPCAS